MRLGRPGQRFLVLDYETTGVDTEKDHPLEVGVIVTDERFRLLETYESFIEVGDDVTPWAGRSLGAFRVHGIEPDEWRLTCQAPGLVGYHLADVAGRHTVRGRKPVLVSDNIQFEWAFTKRLIDLAEIGEWPFHYCGWDTSLLLEATGVGDPKPVHRALPDAGLLHAAIVEALDRTREVR